MTCYTKNKEKHDAARNMKLAGACTGEICKTLGIRKHNFYNWTKDIPNTGKHPLYRISEIQHDYFSDANLVLHPERYTIVGFIAADGCVYDARTGQKRLCFNLSQKDASVLDIINSEIANGQRKLSYIKKTKSVTLSIPSDQLCRDLSTFGIVPRKTRNYPLPNLNGDAMRYFLRGYFYGDGCLAETKTRAIALLVGNTGFINSLAEYLVKEKVITHCGNYEIKHAQHYRQLHFVNRQAVRVTEYLFNDEKMLLLPRKHRVLESVIHGTRWFEEELEWLTSLTLEEVSQKTGRPLSAVKAMKAKLRWPRKIEK